MNSIFENIQIALFESDFSFFVISSTEVHGFHTPEEAEMDMENWQHQHANEEIYWLTRYEAENQFL